MIELVDRTMLALQRALLARAMYPPGLQVESCEEHAFRKVLHLLKFRQKIDVFVLDDRVIFDDTTLPSSANLISDHSLFGLLFHNGVDRITFQNGVDVNQIRSFLDDLDASRSDDCRRLQATTHINFSFIKKVGTTNSTRPNTSHPILDHQKMSTTVGDTWQKIDCGEGFNPKDLSGLITGISQTIMISDYAMLPLAAIKKHDEYTFVHTINVSILSAALGKLAGFNDVVVYDLCMAALLHDIGKRCIPEELLNKYDKLTDEDFKIIQRHPEEGARMLLATPQVPELSVVVAYEHHIRADGSGYPKVPKGWKLNMASRIVQVADVFDALRTNRPYRKALPLPKIIDIMKKDVGTFFDADLLDLFFEYVAGHHNLDPIKLGN